MKNVKTSVLNIVASLSVGCLVLTGCTDQQKQTTVQVMRQINTYAPAVVSAANTVTAMLAANPAIAAVAAPVDTAFDVLANTVQALAASYVAHPDANVLQQLQAAVNTLEVNINTSTLAALKISDPASQQLALVALKGLLTVVTVVFGLVSQTETKAQLLRLRDAGTLHLARVRPYMDESALRVAGLRAGIDVDVLFGRAEAFGL